MAAKVEYHDTTAVTIGYPIADGTPVSGIKKDFWEKVTIDFSQKHLASADWADFYEIPERMLILGMIAVVDHADGQDDQLAIGDADADHTLTWIDDIDDDTANQYTICDHDNTNGALGGKFYPSGGNLYISAVAANEVDSAIISVYIHAIMID